MGADGQVQGEVTLLLLHEESPLRARADLSPEQYRTANEAHMAGGVVAVQGILHRGRRVHRLTDVISVRRVEGGIVAVAPQPSPRTTGSAFPVRVLWLKRVLSGLAAAFRRI